MVVNSPRILHLACQDSEWYSSAAAWNPKVQLQPPMAAFMPLGASWISSHGWIPSLKLTASEEGWNLPKRKERIISQAFPIFEGLLLLVVGSVACASALFVFFAFLDVGCWIWWSLHASATFWRGLVSTNCPTKAFHQEHVFQVLLLAFWSPFSAGTLGEQTKSSNKRRTAFDGVFVLGCKLPRSESVPGSRWSH